MAISDYLKRLLADQRMIEEQKRLYAQANPMKDLVPVVPDVAASRGDLSPTMSDLFKQETERRRSAAQTAGTLGNRLFTGGAFEEARTAQKLFHNHAVGGIGSKSLFNDMRRQRDLLNEMRGEDGSRRNVLDVVREQRRLLAGLVPPPKSGLTSMAEDARQRRLLYEPLKEARRFGLLEDSRSMNAAIASALTFRDERDAMFRRPASREMSRIAAETMKVSRLAQDYLAGGSLRSAMLKAKAPWLDDSHALHSSKAFADLTALGRALADHDPFDGDLVSSLRGSLGDWREEMTFAERTVLVPLARTTLYREQGLDPGITDLPNATFDERLGGGGFEGGKNTGATGDGVPADHRPTDETRATDAFGRLRGFELEMRRFIVASMTAAFGQRWMRQLPPGMRDRWLEKQQNALKVGEQTLELIHFADFTDYRPIIEKGDNWKTVFAAVFNRIEDVRESLQRLQPIRIATMHARIVTLDDELLIRVEVGRILKAIRNAGL